jgi:hypothetical protein
MDVERLTNLHRVILAKFSEFVNLQSFGPEHTEVATYLQARCTVSIFDQAVVKRNTGNLAGRKQAATFAANRLKLPLSDSEHLAYCVAKCNIS